MSTVSITSIIPIPKELSNHTPFEILFLDQDTSKFYNFFPSAGTYSMDIANKIVKHLQNAKLSLLVTKQTEKFPPTTPVNIKLSLLVKTFIKIGIKVIFQF